jgi:uncharacterized membrane protein
LARIEKSIEINVPPEKIWPIVKWENVPQWFDTVKKVEWTSKEHNTVGSTFHVVQEAGGAKMEADDEITEVIENEKMGFRTISGNATVIGSVTLSPTKAGTKVTITQDYELPYSILGKLIDKLRVHKVLENSIEKALKKLKDTMEK